MKYEDKRIVVLDGKERKLDLSDGLIKSNNYIRPVADKSKLCLTICDYSDKNGKGSVSVRFNFTPEEISAYAFMMQCGNDFSETLDRIYNAPDDNGLSPLKRLTISKQARMPDGSPSRYPVRIVIENGRAKCITTETGTVNYSSKTYICEKKADIRLSIRDARRLFMEGDEYVRRMKTVWTLEIRDLDGIRRELENLRDESFLVS